jgi:hypothetical protein
MLLPHEQIQKATLRALRDADVNLPLHHGDIWDVTPANALHELEQLLDRIALHLFMDDVLRAVSRFALLLRLEED